MNLTSPILRIAFIMTHLSHGSPGSFVRVQEIAKSLSEIGIDSTILTPYNEDVKNIHEPKLELIPNLMAKLGMSSFAYKTAKKLSSTKITSKLFLSDKSISRMISLTRNGMRKVLRNKKFDILHAVQPISALACAPLAREFGIPMVTDLHNIWSEEVTLQHDIDRENPLTVRIRALEQEIINGSSALTLTSEEMKNYLLKNFNVPQNVLLTILPPAGPKISPPPFDSKENNVVFAGLVDPADHVDLFAKSLVHVKSRASFYISNRGELLAEIKKITNQEKQAQVNYKWFNMREDALNLLKKSRIGVLTERNDITRQLGPPLKIFDYMACGLPVVANDIGGWTEMISREKIGILTKDDPIDFANAIDLLLSDLDLWKMMATNAIKLNMQSYNWPLNVKKNLEPLYVKLLKH